MAQSTLCVDNKKEQNRAKKKKISQKGRASFQLFKKGGRHQKGAGRHALQKRPRKNTASTPQVDMDDMMKTTSVKGRHHMNGCWCLQTFLARPPQHAVRGLALS